MEYAFEERIGDPDLFTGRKEELDFFLTWIGNIKKRLSQSSALLARRKMGKTALMERLFNITFAKNDGVIPFYYEIKERDMWIADFCQDFFLTFIYQYIAFKTRKKEYLSLINKSDFDLAVSVAEKEGLDYLTDIIDGVAHAIAHEKLDILWEMVRDVPRNLAARQREFVVQMIDEFQFLNAMVYFDKNKSDISRAHNLAGGYLSTAESKIAPLLVSGSWVGWLMNELIMMFPARFAFIFLKNMPEEEAVEMVYKYSSFFNIPVTEESAYLLAQLCEGSPFYISSIFRSSNKLVDLTTLDGLTTALEYETLGEHGRIKATWMEYVASAFPRIDDRNAKHIVLYLCQNKDREVTRKELLEKLSLDMTDGELEKKLKALVRADIISQGQTNFDYRGVNDNIFDKVFRGVYEKEIRDFTPAVIGKEYREAFEKLQKKFNRLQGIHNYHKGHFAEYLIINQLQRRAQVENDFFKSITRYLPADFVFPAYSRVWRYDCSLEYSRAFNVDIFARAENREDYSFIGEVKSRDTKKFTKKEAAAFEKKFEELKKMENIDRAVMFVFSSSGFTKEAEAYCKEKGIACSNDMRWLETETAS